MSRRASTQQNREKRGCRMKKIAKPLFIALGFLSLGLGLVGVALPLLPTTPFLLLTAFCFARGSTRFHRWFVGTKLYRKHIDGFVRTKSMPARTKTSVLVTVIVLLSVAMYFVPHPHARILLGLVMAWHFWYFLFRVKTARPASETAGTTGAGVAAGEFGTGADGGAETRTEEAARPSGETAGEDAK
jgi:uncharacterized membrane protein YbaN (DUF454 family)